MNKDDAKDSADKLTLAGNRDVSTVTLVSASVEDANKATASSIGKAMESTSIEGGEELRPTDQVPSSTEPQGSTSSTGRVDDGLLGDGDETLPIAESERHIQVGAVPVRGPDAPDSDSDTSEEFVDTVQSPTSHDETPEPPTRTQPSAATTVYSAQLVDDDEQIRLQHAEEAGRQSVLEGAAVAQVVTKRKWYFRLSVWIVFLLVGVVVGVVAGVVVGLQSPPSPLIQQTSPPTALQTNAPTPTPGPLAFTSPTELRDAVDAYLSGPPQQDDIVALHGPISSWDVSRIFSFDELFSGLRNQNAADFDEPLLWNTSSAKSMAEMFRESPGGVQKFNHPLGHWDTSQVTDMRNMFNGADLFNHSLNAWDTGRVTDMSSMFAGARSYNQPMDRWDTSQVTDMSFIFSGASSFDQNISYWNTSQVTDLSFAFSAAEVFNHPLYWDTSRVTNMASMLHGARAFNQDIRLLDTSSVTDMTEMFMFAQTFNQPLDLWDTDQVTGMYRMFENAWSFNAAIGAWNTSRVTDMSSMFKEAYEFNHPIGLWDTSSVTNMQEMFDSAYAFAQDINGWNVSNVENIGFMFWEATAFNQPLNQWNVREVSSMVETFNGAELFNQDLCEWGPRFTKRFVSVGRAFADTNCSDPEDPNMTAVPRGPFCYPCT